MKLTSVSTFVFAIKTILAAIANESQFYAILRSTLELVSLARWMSRVLDVLALGLELVGVVGAVADAIAVKRSIDAHLLVVAHEEFRVIVATLFEI